MKKKITEKRSAQATESENPELLSEMEKLTEDLQKAQPLREAFLSAVKENPSLEGKRLLAELDEAIEEGKRRLSALSATEFRRQFRLIAAELTKAIENCDDREFLRLGEESAPARHLRDYAKIRPGMIDALSRLRPEDKPQELLGLFDHAIAAARRQLKEKRSRAEKRFPHLKKEYEMDESYKKALQDLLDAIASRDQLAETLKYALPRDRSEGLRLLAELDKKIEQGEQLLANEFESFQNYERTKDDLRQTIKSYDDDQMRQLRQYIRENPGEMKIVEKLLAEEFPG